uniref:C-type lectin domain-containing protein n=1 Tax=Amphiprion percula TaxID=161767 RepID=A0A3P8T879_AMPPE
QLLGRYQNLNHEKDQLLGRYQNLNRERDQLQTRLTQVLKDVGEDPVHKDSLYILLVLDFTAATRSHLCCVSSGTCPSGWKQFGGSCYFFSLTRSSWNFSRQQCLGQRAHLVVISSRQEMVSLSAETSTSFWIGLSQTSSSSNWEWTDGRSPEATFAAGSSSRMFYSWSSESCTQLMRWVCKKEAVPSYL